MNMKSTKPSALQPVRSLSAMEHSPKTILEQPPAEIAPLTAGADEIQDGGWVAWLQVAGGFALYFNSWYVFDPFGKLPRIKLGNFTNNIN
jgi:hypothetical protein